MAWVPLNVSEATEPPGTSGGSKIIRCVDWLRERGEEVNRELWDGVLEESRTSRRPSVRLAARRMLLDRIDPIPRAPAVEIDVGPVVLGWNLDASPSPTPPGPSSSSSTPALPANGHAPPSSSATDALANL